jgi:hypothetical protein
MATDLARTIARACRWQRRLGSTQIAAAHCPIVADQAHPDGDSNRADEVIAQTEDAGRPPARSNFSCTAR